MSLEWRWRADKRTWSERPVAHAFQDDVALCGEAFDASRPVEKAAKPDTFRVRVCFYCERRAKGVPCRRR